MFSSIFKSGTLISLLILSDHYQTAIMFWIISQQEPNIDNFWYKESSWNCHLRTYIAVCEINQLGVVESVLSIDWTRAQALCYQEW